MCFSDTSEINYEKNLHETSYDNNGNKSAVKHCLTSSVGQGDMSNFREPLTFFNFFDGQLDGRFNSCNNLYKSSSLSLSVSWKFYQNAMLITVQNFKRVQIMCFVQGWLIENN